MSPDAAGGADRASARPPSAPDAADLPDHPLRVRGNRWQDLPAPALGAWAPQLRVSVVVPCHDDHEELPRTLAALGAQTYPADLLEVVVVDDGSVPPLDLPEKTGDVPVRALRLDDEGFGAGRARNAGARAGTGDVVVFVDGDIICAPAHIEAHARWHHLVPDAVTLGMRRFVDVQGIDAAAVEHAATAGELEALFADRPQEPHTWIERHLERHDDLRRHWADCWRITVGASLGVRRTLYDEARGFPEFGIRGTEDTAFGYRLHTCGGLFIPDREAQSWHQGPRSMGDPAAKAAIEAARAAVMANHLPVQRFRSYQRGRQWAVPALAVEVPVAEGRSEEDARATIDAVLASDLHDLVVGVTGEGRARELLRAWYVADPRVQLTDDAAWARAHPDAPIRVRVPPPIRLGTHTLRLVHDRLAAHELGALHLAAPGIDPRACLVDAWTTRALRRAARLRDPDEDPAALLGELFGERWEAGEDFGIPPPGADADVLVSAPRQLARYLGMTARDLAERLASLEEQYARLRQRRVVQLANRAGKVRRLLSPRR